MVQTTLALAKIWYLFDNAKYFSSHVRYNHKISCISEEIENVQKWTFSIAISLSPNSIIALKRLTLLAFRKSSNVISASCIIPLSNSAALFVPGNKGCLGVNQCLPVYVPFKLTVRNDSGVALYHYDNKGVKNSSSFARPGSLALWRTGEASWGDAWLCWYQGNRKNESGIGGWQVNKQSIGYYRGNLPTIFDKLGNGELISLPPVGGYLELQIGTGVVAYDYGKEIKESVYSQCRWLLYKDAAIDVVQHTGSSISAQDIETKAWLNRDAKEGLKIDTKLGCMDSPSPAALGQLFKTSDFSACNSFWRAGNTDTLERLMIGTIYSQYAEPLKKLGGEVDILTDFGIYTDKHEPGNYIVLAESQDLRNDTDSIVMVQVLNDNYTAVKYE